MSLYETLRAAGLTARITVATVAEGLRHDVPPEVVDQRLAWWAREILRDARITLHVRGVENIPPDEPLVIMSNHRSYYDIPAAFASVPGRIRMVAKKELFRVPLFGRAMAKNGFIKVDRGDRKKAVESLNESKRLLDEGTRVWIAPEGTRSKDGTLGKFKSGGFHLAMDAGVRILPMVVEGTEKIMAHDSFVVHGGATVTVTILPPVDPKKYGPDGRKALMSDVRAAMERALAG